MAAQREKTVYRLDFSFFDAQEAFLNRMAAKGWQLSGVDGNCYQFARCDAGAFHYCVDFVGAMPPAELERYQRSLSEAGCRVVAKRVSRSPQQVLLLERPRDGTPFPQHSDRPERQRAYRDKCITWGISTALLLIIAACAAAPQRHLPFWLPGAALVLTLAAAIPLLGYLLAFLRGRKKGKA